MFKITIVHPGVDGVHTGNVTTADRWAKLLRSLGNRVRVVRRYDGHACDVLVALHARKSAAALQLFQRLFPQRPAILAITGTDLYRDSPSHPVVKRSMQSARAIVVLHPLALEALPQWARRKTHVIYQSARAPAPRRRRPAHDFDVAVVAHLRPIKDPLRAALAVRRLPASSRIHVHHVGRGLSQNLARRARVEAARNARYTWHGELTPLRTHRMLAASSLLVLSSRAEGGANVVSEAAVAGVPVLASRIPGNVGLLGARYAGYFDRGATRQLAILLERCENDARFYARLRRSVLRLARRFEPERERGAWARLLAGL